ncbi:hypothetical protein SNEBB_004639 [Seison nebaliae]|nr:hypothetical protein SNEBB_004639 [Seison nebaliae]
MNKILFTPENVSSDIKSDGEKPNDIIRPLGGTEKFLALQLKWALQYQDIVTTSVLGISTSKRHQSLLNDSKYLLRALQLWTRKYAMLRCYLKQMDKNDITSLAYTSFGSKLSVEQIMEQVEIYDTVEEWLKHRPSDNKEVAQTGRLIRFHYEDDDTKNKVPWWNREMAYQMSAKHDVHRRPLWRLILLKNREFNEFILIIPLHHCIVDGVSAKHFVDDFINIWLTEMQCQLKSDINVTDGFEERYENQKVEILVNSLDSFIKFSDNVKEHREEKNENGNELQEKKKYSFLQMKNKNIPVNSGSPKFMSTFIKEEIMKRVMKKIKDEQCKATAALITAMALAWRRTCKQTNYIIDDTVTTSVAINFTNSIKGLQSSLGFARAVAVEEKDEVGLINIPANDEEKERFWKSAKNIRKDFDRILNSKESVQKLMKQEIEFFDYLELKDDITFTDDSFNVNYCLSNIGNFLQKPNDFFVNDQFYLPNGIMENLPYGGFIFGITSNNGKLCFGLEYDSRAASETFMLKLIENLQDIFKSNIFV